MKSATLSTCPLGWLEQKPNGCGWGTFTWIGKLSPDGNTVEFDFLDVSGGNANGHMHQSVFTIIDANHHTEDWTHMSPNDKPAPAHIDLVRAK